MNYISLKYVTNLHGIAAVSALLSDHQTNNYAMLLDSGLTESESQSLKSTQKFKHAGYDIFCSNPCLTLTMPRLSNEKLKIHRLSSSITKLKVNSEEQDPLKQMRDILAQVKQLSINPINPINPINSGKNDVEDSNLPFNGGWLGYFSYEFGKSLELPKQDKLIDSDIPFCRFGLYLWALINDHKKQTTRLYNFGLSSDEWKYIQSLFNNRQKVKSNADNKFRLEYPFKSNINFESYQKSFNQIKENIIAGNCYQINYAHQFSTSFKGNSFEAYQQLTRVNQSPFSAYLNFGDFQILSLSPERFIKVENRNLLTQPIKGTAPRSNNMKIDQQNALHLLSSEKDRAENLMIVDLLRNDLSKTADVASVSVPELFGLYSFQSVHHLISTVTSKLAPQYDVFDVLQSCLPGGSITGAPKIAAMKIIDELESFSRGIYCGVIGYMDFEGKMDTNICIRTLLTKDGQITCCAGGGIVFDSNENSEYQETFHKVSKIIPLLEKYFLEFSCVEKRIEERG